MGVTVVPILGPPGFSVFTQVVFFRIFKEKQQANKQDGIPYHSHDFRQHKVA